MSEFAYKRMTVDEFLVWDDGTDTRYELFDGVPVAMALTTDAHQIIVGNASVEIGALLKARPPCRVQPEAGILKPNSFRNYFHADLAVTCTPHELGQRGMRNPIIIIEVLSPSTDENDRKVKLPVYRSIESVQEIVLIHTEQVYAEVHRRLDATRWQVDLLTEPEDVLRLDSVGYAQPLALLYANVDLGKSPTAVASGESAL